MIFRVNARACRNEHKLVTGRRNEYDEMYVSKWESFFISFFRIRLSPRWNKLIQQRSLSILCCCCCCCSSESLVSVLQICGVFSFFLLISFFFSFLFFLSGSVSFATWIDLSPPVLHHEYYAEKRWRRWRRRRWRRWRWRQRIRHVVLQRKKKTMKSC